MLTPKLQEILKNSDIEVTRGYLHINDTQIGISLDSVVWFEIEWDTSFNCYHIFNRTYAADRGMSGEMWIADCRDSYIVIALLQYQLAETGRAAEAEEDLLRKSQDTSQN